MNDETLMKWVVLGGGTVVLAIGLTIGHVATYISWQNYCVRQKVAEYRANETGQVSWHWIDDGKDAK